MAWRRPGKHSTKTKAGIGIEFLPTETQARDYLLGVARGDSAEMVARRHQRLPVEIPVLWQVPGELHDNAGVLRDIGRGGAFIKTEQPLPMTATSSSRCRRPARRWRCRCRCCVEEGRYVKARHVFVAEDTAQIVVDWSIDGKGPKGEDVHLGGSASDIVRRGADGFWRYIIDNNQGTAVRQPA